MGYNDPGLWVGVRRQNQGESDRPPKSKKTQTFQKRCRIAAWGVHFTILIRKNRALFREFRGSVKGS
jgi:hypothetical protein